MEESLIWFEKGVTLFEKGNYHDAITAFDKAIAINPKIAEAWHNRGLALFQTGQYRNALLSFNNTLSINPQHENAKNCKKIILEQLDEQKNPDNKSLPQKIAVDGNYANLWPRMKSWLVDSLIILLFYFFLTLSIDALIYPFVGYTDDTKSVALLISTVLTIFFVFPLYFAYYESSIYQATLGKQFFNIFVTDLSGKRLTFSRALMRFFLRTVMTYGPIFIPFTMCAINFSSKKQGIHDKIIGTMVFNESTNESTLDR